MLLNAAVLVLTAAAAANEYSAEMLMLRLRRLEEQNAALLEAAAELESRLPNCSAFVQTGGCDPDGPVEERKGCEDQVPKGASGYCECRDSKRSRVACDHPPFRCAEVCGQPASRAATAAVVAVTASGQQQQQHTPSRIDAPLCAEHRGCSACSAIDGCAWCLQTRRCVSDEPWICQGEEDHVSHPQGVPQQGKPGKARCPTAGELEAQRKARIEREVAASQRAKPSPRGTPSARGSDADGVRTGWDDAQERARRRVVKTSTEEVRRLRGEAGVESAAPAEGSPEKEAAAAAAAAAAAHLDELKRRVSLSEEERGGASEPYETLGLPLNCTQQEVRKAYKRLALQFHPDKNREGLVAELAHVAFTEVVAAFEVLGTPDKRAAFDEASLGSGGRFEGNFNARWENHEFEWDSDMYKGAQYGAPPGGGSNTAEGSNVADTCPREGPLPAQHTGHARCDVVSHTVSGAALSPSACF